MNPHVMRPDHAPTPFTAAEIRDATPAGHTVETVTETEGAVVARQRTVFADDLSAFHERGGGSPASRQTRELLRFAGIELFAQLHHGTRWRLFRAVHRRALRHADADNAIAELLRREWSAGHDQLTTSSVLRQRFLDGVMSGSETSRAGTPSSSTQRTGGFT